jgi:two-component system chemotaxis response regulator CheY
LRRILLVRGFEVSEAGDGRMALDVLHEMGTADLVVVDVALHEPESVEFITRLRHEAARHTEIVILAEAELGTRELQRALIAGADNYLVKPFTTRQIDEKLAQAGFHGHLDLASDRTGHSCRY